MKFRYLVLANGVDKLENGFGGVGDWVLLKVFVENKNGYGEFYINLNKATGEGEIVPKEFGCAHFLIKEFTKTMVGNLGDSF